jgi:hypothetical protein
MIKRVTSTAILLAAIACTACAAGTTAALAEEKTLILPNRGGVLFRIRGRKSTLTLRGGSAITCRSSAGEGTSENGNLGRVLLLYTECTSILETICTSEGSGRGLVHFEGEYHFILALLTERLVAAFVLLFRQIRLRCVTGAIEEAETIEPGCIAALAGGERLAELNSLVSSIRISFTQTSNGVQDIQRILPPEARTFSECKTEAKIGSGRLEPISLDGEAEISGFVQEGTVITANFMNPEGA